MIGAPEVLFAAVCAPEDEEVELDEEPEPSCRPWSAVTAKPGTDVPKESVEPGSKTPGSKVSSDCVEIPGSVPIKT
jgi:hypothetical protein